MNKEQIQKQINTLKKRLELIEQSESENFDGINKLEDITLKDKIDAFDSLYHQAFEYIKTIAKTGYEPKDGSHYLYEAVIDLTLGHNAWSIIQTMRG